MMSTLCHNSPYHSLSGRSISGFKAGARLKNPRLIARIPRQPPGNPPRRAACLGQTPPPTSTGPRQTTPPPPPPPNSSPAIPALTDWARPETPPGACTPAHCHRGHVRRPLVPALHPRGPGARTQDAPPGVSEEAVALVAFFGMSSPPPPRLSENR